MPDSELPRDAAWRELLRRDRARRRSADESRQVALCQIMWSVRHVVVGSAVLWQARANASGDLDPVLALYAAIQLAFHVATRVFSRQAARITLADAAVLILFAGLGVPYRVVLMLVVAMLGWAATFRPYAAIGTFLLALTAALVASIAEGVATTEPALVAFAMLGCVFMIRTIRLNMSARAASDLQRLAAERIDAVMWEEVPGATGTRRVTSAAVRLLGYPVEAWQAPGFLQEVVHPDDLAEAAASFSGHRDRPVTVRMRRADGAWRWMENRVSREQDRRGKRVYLVGVLLDRTEQVEAEREALAFGHLVSSSPIGQMLLRCDGNGAPVIEAVNRSCQRVVGLGPDAVGSRLDSHPSPARELAAQLQHAMTGGGQRAVEMQGRDGRIHQVTFRRIDDHACTADFLDITERVESGRQMHAQARQDHLTLLPNRRAFLEALEARVALPHRPSTTVLLIDLDRFKDINDSLGHDIGDQLLCRVGERLAHRTRPDDLVARLGGDEFALLLNDVPPEEAEQRAAELAEVINQAVAVGDLRLRVRASVGVASFPLDAADSSELVRCADVAMYHAKSRGLGVARYGAGIGRFGREQLALVADLEHAITRDELLLHHQPVIDVASGAVVGSEALVRWQHPELGVIRPDVFIELAEVSGQMKSLTRWVIRQALRDLQQLAPTHPAHKVSVNLSVRNLYEPDFLSWMTEQITAHRIDPRCLTVEITETTIMDDQPAACELIEALGALGVQTWIDDFGTGHSSLSRLRTLPVHGVKIDRSFLAQASESETDRLILRGLIQLTRSMGLDTVAEGIESASCLDVLRAEGCTFAQGYLIGHPMPLALLTSVLPAAGEDAADLETAAAPVLAG